MYFFYISYMKNFPRFLSLENIKTKLTECFKRFPIPVIISLILAGVLYTLVHSDLDNDMSSYLVRGVFTLIITFFLSVASALIVESRDEVAYKKASILVFPLIFWVFFYTTFQIDTDNLKSIIFFLITFIWILATVFVAPYLKKTTHKKTTGPIYYSYFYQTSRVFLMSWIVGVILFSLGSIGITAVFTLFDIGFPRGDIYGDWAIFALSIFAPLFGLSNFPQKQSYEKNTFVENTFFSFIIKYIATPCICVYFVILYAYTVKVLLNFSQWPTGEVSWLVIWFSVFGYIVYMFSEVFSSSFRLVEVFRKYFPIVVIPQIAMLFYAISLRIYQYDITINRYFVVVFGLWLLGVSLYFVLSKYKYIAQIPASIALCSIVISVGPWSVYTLPENRQTERLKTLLTETNILQNGKIIASESENLDPKTGWEIYDSIRYICDLWDCSPIKEIFSEQYAKLEQDQKNSPSEKDIPPTKWIITNRITKSIGVKPYNSISQNNNSPYNYYYSVDQNDIFPLETTWYTQILKVYDLKWYQNPTNTRIEIDTISQTLSLLESSEQKVSTSISSILVTIESERPGETSPEKLIFDIRSETINGKLILTSIDIPNPNYTGTPIEYRGNVGGYFLLR